jgi:GNAT superfamily N-acetyltransferase
MLLFLLQKLSEMKIRQAKINDALIIHSLANEIWCTAYKDIISDEQISFMLEDMYSESVLRHQLQEGRNFLLAERDSAPVGFAEYSFISPTEKVFKLHKLYILPSEQGKGTGKEILDHITGLVRTQGGEILELNVNRGNPAVNFYKKLGFEIWKTVDIPYHNFVLNDYVMRKKI